MHENFNSQDFLKSHYIYFETWLDLYIKPFKLNSEICSELKQHLADEVNLETVDPNSHKINILSGDFRNNLKPEAINFFNQFFFVVFSRLQYEL